MCGLEWYCFGSCVLYLLGCNVAIISVFSWCIYSGLLDEYSIVTIMANLTDNKVHILVELYLLHKMFGECIEIISYLRHFDKIR